MNERSGWIKLWRQLARNELWLAERFTRGQAWIDLLMSAAHVEHQVVRAGRVINVPRGCVLTSQASLAERWQWTRETVAKYLRLLAGLNMIADISSVRGADIGYTRFQINNYERFQGKESERADISSDISPGILPSFEPTFSRHTEEWRERTTKNGKKGKKRADARTPSTDVSSLNGHRSRKHVDADWGR